MALAREQREVELARENLGNALDDLEKKFSPSHITRVSSWWVRRSAKKHPIVWTAAVVGAIALVIGLISWAILDDSAEN